LRKAPSLRNNNGALQVRVRLDGKDCFINRLGRWEDPVARARAQSIAAEIWRDYQQGTLDWSLSRYKPLVSGQDPELLKALEDLMLRKRQGRTTHAYRVVRRYGGALRSEGEVSAFLRWMEAEGLAPATRSTILSTIRSVQPANKALASAVIKVPHRSVQEELLSKREIQRVLEDLRVNEDWYYPIFAVWLGTGLRNAELIGLTWDCVRLEEGELLISKTLRRDGVATHRRQWSGTKTGKSRVVPLREDLVVLLQEHQQRMGGLGLNTRDGLVFVTPMTHRHLYDSGLERVWKRSQRRVGLQPRRLYAQRHSFLSHALAMGNSPADLAAVAGHRTEQLLNTYAKPTGRVLLPSW
jgi:integrase